MENMEEVGTEAMIGNLITFISQYIIPNKRIAHNHLVLIMLSAMPEVRGYSNSNALTILVNIFVKWGIETILLEMLYRMYLWSSINGCGTHRTNAKTSETITFLILLNYTVIRRKVFAIWLVQLIFIIIIVQVRAKWTSCIHNRFKISD